MPAARSLSAKPLHVALLLGPDAIDVYGASLRHLCIGLFDEGLRVSLVADDALGLGEQSMGPASVHSIPHQAWFMPREALGRVAEKLADEHCHLLHSLTESALGWLPALQAELDVPAVASVTHATDVRPEDQAKAEPAATASAAGISLVDHRNPFGGWSGLNYRWRGHQARRGRGFVTRWLALSPRVAASHRRLTGNEVPVVGLGMIAAEASSCFASDTREVGVLTVCPLEKHCGVRRLLDSIHQLDGESGALLAFISGEGTDEHALRQQAQRLGLLKRVTFAPPLMDWRPITGSLDLYVQPGPLRQIRSDLLEAMASGMACIASRDSAEQWIEDGVTGLIIPPRDTPALAAALRRLLGDRDLARQLGERARAAVRERFGASRMVSALVEQYRAMLALPSTAGRG